MSDLAAMSIREPKEELVEDVDLKAMCNEMKKTLKAAKKSGVPVYQAAGSTSGSRPQGFSLLWDAQMALFGGEGFRGERLYHAFFESLKQDQENWMSFLSEPGNNVYAERASGILGTLATIHRQRNELDVAEEVLDMEGTVLQMYNRHALASDEGRRCFEELEYKYNIIKYNLYYQTGRRDRCVDLFRQLCLHELSNGLSFDDQNFAYMLNVVNVEPTLAGLKKCPDAKIRDIFAFTDAQLGADALTSDPDLQKQSRKANKRTCGSCQTQEQFRGDFSLCSRCKKVAYCSKDCQKSHWKQHKKECAK